MKRRPLLALPWTIWLKPGVTIHKRAVLFVKEHGIDAQGRIRVQIVDDFDREYWLRLTRWQYRLFGRV